jgi:hypothetical protein
MRKFNFNPSLLRRGYDFIVAVYSLLFVYLINGFTLMSDRIDLVSLLPLYILLLSITGIYSHKKFANVTTKSILIISASFLLIFLSYLFFRDIWPSIQFVTIAAPMLILARLFLNVNNRFIRISTKLSNVPRRILVVGGGGLHRDSYCWFAS